MPKPKLDLNLVLQDFPVPNPPYSSEASKTAYILYLIYHAQQGSEKTTDELFADFTREYQGAFSRLQDFVFKYMSTFDPDGESNLLFPAIEEIEQGPYSTISPWHLFLQFAKEWFHKAEVHEAFICRSSSLFLCLTPTQDYREFHVFVKPQPTKEN